MHPRLLLSQKLRADFRSANLRRRLPLASPETVAEQQLKQLAAQWEDATNDIPYYAQLVAGGVVPKQLLSWEDFQQIPVLTRQELQSQPEAFLRKSGPPASFMKTAGSTGTPLKLGLNQADRDLMRVVKLAEWRRFGYSPSSRLFLIWGHSHLLGTGWRGRLNHLRRKAADAFLGYQRVDAYRLDPSSCARYAEQLIQFRPLGLIGYASALDLFARHTAGFRDRYRNLGLRFILATSEPPPKPDSFALLSDLFNCPVVQEYGGAEFGQVAFHPGQGGFQVYSDLNYLECQSPEADEPGAYPVLVSTLYDRYLPLFRYRVGDAITRPQTLANGHVERFESVAGRINDVIPMADGSSIHSVAIFHCIHQEPAVHNIQMHLNDERIQIRLLVTSGDDTALTNRIRARLAQVHADLAKAEIVLVEDLATSRAGKRRWFIDERNQSSVPA
jgi:phenylacetate-CoA ligase